VSERVRLDAVVRGRVQGVGFRYFVIERARDLGLDGWVANEADGSVRCQAEGARSSLDALVTALWTGPSGAWVDDVALAWGPARGDLGPFTVRFGAHRGD
jgi:acylphosphatase